MTPVLIHPAPVLTPGDRAAALVMASASLQPTIEYLVQAGAGDLITEVLKLKQAIVRHHSIGEAQP